MPHAMQSLIFTLGHSTRAIQTFIDLLKSNRITLVADIRSIPRSRHNPQFNKDVLPDELAGSGIGYEHMPGLGGLRHVLAGSRNGGWRNSSFRGFADYMQTAEFETALNSFIGIASMAVTTLMCAEALPWRCHRSLIADALTIRGIEVEHIMGPGKLLRHTLTPWADVQGTTLQYPPPRDSGRR